jgi:hypothetical protein
MREWSQKPRGLVEFSEWSAIFDYRANRRRMKSGESVEETKKILPVKNPD